MKAKIAISVLFLIAAAVVLHRYIFVDREDFDGVVLAADYLSADEAKAWSHDLPQESFTTAKIVRNLGSFGSIALCGDQRSLIGHKVELKLVMVSTSKCWDIRGVEDHGMSPQFSKGRNGNAFGFR